MYWSGLVSDQLFLDHSLFYPFAGAGDSGAVTLQANGGWLEPSIRYADDMVIILRPNDDAEVSS